MTLELIRQGLDIAKEADPPCSMIAD